MASNKHTVITRPVARSERLLVEAVGNETVIYDLETSVAHALKPLAAAVYAYADGTNTVAEIAELASYRLDQQIVDADVAAAVEELDQLQLLDTPELELGSGGLSRRDALKVLAATGAGAALVSSVAAPFASATTSLATYGQPYVCGSTNNLNPITDYSGYSNVKNSKAPDGWYQPYSYNGSSWSFTTGSNPGAPVTANDYSLGAECYAAVPSCNGWGGSTIYGTYQAVPCDGSYSDSNSKHYECCQVVCVPTTTGAKGGPATSIAGAITSGSILPASDADKDLGAGKGYGKSYYDAEYSGWPFKFCCPGNTCTS